MKLEVYHIDAFTSENSEGNPACVILLKDWLNDDLLLKIAKLNAIPETAFIVIEENFSN